jgi:hypothetical protein
MRGTIGLGWGLPTPAVPLEVNVDAASDSELLRLTNTNAAGGSFVIIDRTGVTRTASTIYSTGVTGAWHTGILRDGGSSTFGYSISTASDNNVAEPFFLLTTGGGLTLTPNASSPAVFNEGGVDADFRVESDTQTHAFFVDAGTSRVGINSGAPQYKLHVVGGNGDQLWLDNAGEQFTQQYWANSGTVKGAIWLDNTNSKFEIYGYGSIGTTIYSNTAERVHFKSTGEAVFNDTGNDYDFRVESDTDTHAFFVDAASNNVGIGTSSPASKLEVASGNLTVSGDAIATVGQIDLIRRGILSSSAGVGIINFQGYSTGTTVQTGARIQAEGAGTWTSTSTPANVLFYTTPSASTSPAERMRITSSGGIEIPNQNAIDELTFTGTDFTNVFSATTSGFQLGTTGAGYLAHRRIRHADPQARRHVQRGRRRRRLPRRE